MVTAASRGVLGRSCATPASSLLEPGRPDRPGLFLVSGRAQITVLEGLTEPYEDPRAATFHPPTMEMFAPSGVTDRLHELGIVCPQWQFRGRDEGVVAAFDLGVLADVTPFPIGFSASSTSWFRPRRELSGNPKFQLHYGATVTAVSQSAAGTTVTTADGSYSRAARDWRRRRPQRGPEIPGYRFRRVHLSGALSCHHHSDRSGNAGFAYSAYVSDPNEWARHSRCPGRVRPVYGVFSRPWRRLRSTTA